MTNQFLGLMLDPFVDGRNGAAGLGGPAIAFAPEREALPDDIALAYSSVLKAPPVRAPSFEQRWTRGAAPMAAATACPAIRRCWAATTSPRHRRLCRRPRLSRYAQHRRGRGARRWWRQLGPCQRSRGGKSDAFQAGAYGATRWGAAYVAAALVLQPSLDVDRPLRLRRRPSHRPLQRAVARRAGGKRLSLRHHFGGLTPYAAVQAQNSAPRATARPTSTAAASGSATTAAPAPTPAASSAPASTTCWRSIRTPCSRCGRGWPGRTTG